MRLIALMTAWACRDWVEKAVFNAISYADELWVCVAPHSSEFVDMEDGTVDVLDSYKTYSGIHFHETGAPESIADNTKCRILNEMMRKAKPEPGDVLMVVDADEFYLNGDMDTLMEFAKTDFDVGMVRGYYFCINLNWFFINESMMRMFKYRPGFQYVPTQKPNYNATYTDTGVTMLHYTMLQSLEMKRRYWSMSPVGNPVACKKKVRWVDEVYAKWDVNNEDESKRRNQEVTGRYGFWHGGGMVESDGGLFSYGDGEHPEDVVEAFGKIQDFREKR